MLTVGMMLAVFSNVAGATELQWRKAGPKRFKPTADSQPISAASKTAAAKVKPRQDGAVKQVRFEGEGAVEGPRFSAQQTAGPDMKSVVVERDNTFDESPSNVRSAQLEFRPRAEGDNRYGEQMLEPFGQETTTETEESEALEEDISLPPAETAPQEESLLPPAGGQEEIVTPPANEQRQPPRTFQPAPSRNTPRPDPFVEADDEPNAGLPPVDDATLADEGADAQEDCDEELAKLKARTLYEVDLNIAVNGDPGQDFPFECSIDDGSWHQGRCWCETTYMWKASALCHKPLYFEDEALERYGHSWGPCCDPLVSGAHFFCTLPVLPYCMGVHPPNECMYALGHYRPGNCAPYMISPVPISARGAIFQAGAVVGAAAILP